MRIFYKIYLFLIMIIFLIKIYILGLFLHTKVNFLKIKFNVKSFFDKKYRIVGLNLFEEGISPKWEDPKNANGTTFTLSYEIRDRDDLRNFLNLIREYWLKLIMIVLGESCKSHQYVN